MTTPSGSGTRLAAAGGYPFPPLVPTDPDVLAARLSATLGRAWDEVQARRAAVLASTLAHRRNETLQRLDELQAATRSFQAVTLTEAQEFARRSVPAAYAAGAVLAPSAAEPFRWTQFHIDAAQSLAADSYEDFLARSQEAGRTSDAFARHVREVARDRTAFAVTGDKTAVQVARELEARLAERGITAATYANGAVHSMRDWTAMAVRTKTAVAHNAGSLNRYREVGVTYVEVFDGSSCGWSGHDDPSTANGSIRTVEEAAAQPISHPNCRRAFGARPDIVGPAEARDAALSTTAAQREAQRQEEQRRAGTVGRSERVDRSAARAAMTARRAQRTVLAARSPLAGVALDKLSDDALYALQLRPDVMDDEDSLARLYAELDRRDEQGAPPALPVKAPGPAAPRVVDVAAAMRKADRDLDDDERAAVQAFYRSMHASDDAAVKATAGEDILPPRKLTARAQAVEDWQLVREAELSDAGQATNGAMIRRGAPGHVTEHWLWEASASEAARWASEELLNYWQAGGRRTTVMDAIAPASARAKRSREAFAKAVVQAQGSVARRTRRGPG